MRQEFEITRRIIIEDHKPPSEAEIVTLNEVISALTSFRNRGITEHCWCGREVASGSAMSRHKNKCPVAIRKTQETELRQPLGESETTLRQLHEKWGA